MLAAHPDNFDALYLTGLLEMNEQQYAAAIEHLKAAAAINPNHYDVRYQLGLAFFKTQQNEAAREQLEKAVALNPDEAQAHFQLAQVLRSLGKEDEAQAQMRLYQERAQAEVKRALAANKSSKADKALKSGDAKSAVGLYREAVAARPDDPIMQYNLAQALDRAGDKAAEQTALEAAVQLRPNFPEAQNRLGYLSALAGDLRFVASAKVVGPGGEVGHDREAETWFRSAVASNPRYAPAWVNLAATLASESRFGEARSAVGAALKVDPSDAEALRLRQMLPVSSADRQQSPAAAGSAAPRPQKQ